MNPSGSISMLNLTFGVTHERKNKIKPNWQRGGELRSEQWWRCTHDARALVYGFLSQLLATNEGGERERVGALR